MNTTGLQYFLVTAEEMNFSRAAERLLISQQSLSGAIQRLEKQYGVLLFERKPVMKLTPAGEAMCSYAELILRTEQQMISRFADLSHENNGKLSFGCSRTRAELFFPSVWEKYHPQFPNIDLSMVSGIVAQFEYLLQSGKIDMFVGVDPQESFNTVQIPLSEERQFCVMTLPFLQKQMPDRWHEFLRQARKTGVDLKDIRDFPFILLPPLNRFREALDNYFASVSIVPRVIFETSQHRLIYSCSSRSYGVGLISQMYLYQPLLHSEERPKDLLVLPIKNDLGAHHIKLVYRKDRPLPRYALAFANAIQETFDEYNSTIEAIISEISRETAM